MAVFSEFETKYGGGIECRQADPDVIQRYRDRLPASLLEHWQQVGWCAYDDGFLWMTNPDDYKPVLEEWLGDRAAQYDVFGRTAFGDLLLWGPEGVYELFVHQARLLFYIDDIEAYFEFALTLDAYLDGTMGRPLFRTLFAEVGGLARDEMYGFEPAISLGGTGDIETVVKVRIYEHLSILAQIVDGV